LALRPGLSAGLPFRETVKLSVSKLKYTTSEKDVKFAGIFLADFFYLFLPKMAQKLLTKPPNLTSAVNLLSCAFDILSSISYFPISPG